MRMLLVGDAPLLQPRLGEYLGGGFTLEYVDQMEDAPEALDERSYERVIILAGYMRGGTGLKLLRLVREESRFKAMPIIYIDHYTVEIHAAAVKAGGIFADEGKLPTSLSEALTLAETWKPESAK